VCGGVAVLPLTRRRRVYRRICTCGCRATGQYESGAAVPELTVPEVTDAPIVVPPCETVKVTVRITVPPPLVTVAESVTF